MADLHVHRDRLEVRLSAAEKVLALRRDDLVIPRSAIRSVAITQDPWIWIRGVRVPGAAIPLTLAIGTWKYHGGKDFLIVKGKSRPAVVIDIAQDDLAGGDGDGEGTPKAEKTAIADGYDRVIVSTTHAAKLIEALRDPIGAESNGTGES
ncbi:hypothetical protein GCM10022286_22790 [Gryllotalpicola daejeonensis]|uniref:Uncharacterized protein n=1 Tax=Gryllotalpicola daejeonensis TaxID=993087 RepID=A0ABP7ZLG7_9MICO